MSHTSCLIPHKISLLFQFHLPLQIICVFSPTHFLFIFSLRQVLNQRCTTFPWSACCFHFTSSPTPSSRVSTLLSSLSSLFIPSTSKLKVCLLQNHQSSCQKNCGHGPSLTAMPIYLVISLLFCCTLIK
jgi:hypothetical protein